MDCAVNWWRTIALAFSIFSLLATAQLESASCAEGKRLIELWRESDGITVVALGDSITAGVGLREPQNECYASLVSSMLAKWLAPTRVRLITYGIPGATTDVGLREIESVLKYSPDLVLIQFGGNDSRLRRPIDEIKGNLIGMIKALREKSKTAILLIVPPFQTPAPNSPVAEAIREIGREAGVIVADFDKVLHECEHDFRGWFSPPPSHPGEYSHVLMAKELWNALLQLVGVEHSLDVHIGSGVTWVTEGSSIDIPVALINRSRKAMDVNMIVDHAGVWHNWLMTVDASSSAQPKLKVKPPIETSLRFVRERITAIARCGEDFDWDVKWATWTPAFYCDKGGMWLGERRIDGWLEFATNEHVVVGGNRWRGPDDLSFRLRLERSEDGEAINLNISVRDDVVVVKPTWDFKCLFSGDCVEVFVDHRPIHQQGKPFFSKDVTMIAIVPGSKSLRVASWYFDEVEPTFSPPSGRWVEAKLKSEFTASGYDVELTIPVSVFNGLPAVSFDVLVDDTDDRSGRKTQMAAFGWEDDFRNTSPFALLLLKRLKTLPRWRLTVN
jgi:lysophospholipase L1-like esterase